MIFFSTVFCAALVSSSIAQEFDSEYSSIRPIVKVLVVETLVFALCVLYWNHRTKIDYHYKQGADKEERYILALVLLVIPILLSTWGAVEYGVFGDSSGPVFLIANIMYLVGVFVVFVAIEHYIKKVS